MKIGSNRRVWIFNHYAESPDGSGGLRHYKLARELLLYGWSPVIIAANTNHPGGKVKRLIKGRFLKQDYDGVKFIWLRTPSYTGSGLRRMLNMAAYTLSSFLQIFTKKSNKPAVVIGSSVHPFAAVSAMLVAKIFGVPFIFEVRDLWPHTLVVMGRLPDKGWVTYCLRMIERSLCANASYVISPLPGVGDYMKERNIRHNAFKWISNGSDASEWSNRSIDVCGNTGRLFTLLYFGSHGPANDLSNLLAAMAVLHGRGYSSQLRLIMIGDGPKKNELKKYAENNGLDNIIFHDSVPHDEIHKYAESADAFVLCVRNMTGLYAYGISMNKIFEYMAGSRPIIISVEALNNPIEEVGAGVTVPPSNPEALADGIIRVMRMPPETRASMGNAGRRAVETKYSYRELGLQLRDVLNEVINR